jgi:bifunctional UDP-N-acetylglucosamine pyrophosphorylase/glucosamine-1-phosphate N-acetyltransferase
VLRDARGEVARIVEHNDATDDERRVNEINTGLIAFDAPALRRYLGDLKSNNAQREYYLTDVIGMAVADRVPVDGIVAESPTEVIGINDRAQLAAAERALQRRQAADLMERGVTLADPERLDVRGEVVVGRDVFIDVGVVLEGRVVLGDRVHIEAYAHLRNCTLGNGTVVHPHCVLENSAAGDDCVIGPFSRLRPGVVLSGHVKVGNFVEMKNSHIAAHSKVNHLTYVGGSTVGTRVNVGAGTITRFTMRTRPDRDRRQRVHRLGRHARRARRGRRRRDDRRRLHDHEGHAGRRADARAVEAGDDSRLAASEEETQVKAFASEQRPRT